LPLVF